CLLVLDLCDAPDAVVGKQLPDAVGQRSAADLAGCVVGPGGDLVGNACEGLGSDALGDEAVQGVVEVGGTFDGDAVSLDEAGDDAVEAVVGVEDVDFAGCGGLGGLDDAVQAVVAIGPAAGGLLHFSDAAQGVVGV